MELSVLYSKRKTLALEVTREGRVLVRAPQGTSAAEIEPFVNAHRAWLEKHLTIVEERRRRHPEPTREEELRLRREARAYVPHRVEELARQMGVSYTGVRINFAKGRFGSCSGKNSLNFSARIMQYSPHAIDYVIVHELAHTVEHNHSSRFWRIVEQYMPDYREAEKELKG
ncbi:MAG: M48 family metallopeptidase [Clostridia bacterium]|nr:M48 family metallopeptidase [Clostridia bacterium]